MAKRVLKDALSIRAQQEDFISRGGEENKETSPQKDKSTKRQISKPVKVRPVKVGFYWSPETENAVEEFRLKLRKQGKRLTRSEVAERLVKFALKNEKQIEEQL